MDICLDNISVTLGGKQIIKNLSYCFKSGERYIIHGASGIGKTTLLKAMVGIAPLAGGKILGLESKKIGMAFQEPRLIENISVSANIKMVLNKERSSFSLEKELLSVGLDVLPSQIVSSLSGGMKQRIAVIRALIVNPDIIVLDEALSGLDEESAKLTIKYIEEKTKNKILIAVTHNVDFYKGLNPHIIDFKDML
ncbi:MAG: ATP-binding cassette domain-containing protein [Oscillospiraceae bacterium]